MKTITLLFLLTVVSPAKAFELKSAEQLSKLALKCLHREYPNKLDHVMGSAEEVLEPHVLHPVFYGCYDWHSSVHGHWMLVRLLKTMPSVENASTIRAELNKSFTPENVAKEIAYLDQAGRKSFERTYGWAWIFKLSEELHDWNDPDGARWKGVLEPLTKKFAGKMKDFLPKQDYPIRTGVHPNTAFAIGFAIDYARKTGDAAFEKLLVSRARDYYLNDKRYPLVLEPGGEDFFSPSLIESSLMRRVLAEKDFHAWNEKFFGKINERVLAPILKPAVVGDRTDPKIVHLDGLNLSRAWCMHEIASSYAQGSSERKLFEEAALAHEKAAVPFITSGNYEGEHWLASFAVYLLAK